MRDTKALMDEYRGLAKAGKNQQANTLLSNNRDNKRFVSLVELRTAFFDSFEKELRVQANA